MVGGGLQQGEVVPIEACVLRLVAHHSSCADGNLGAIQTQQQVAVEAHTISEEHVVEVEVLLQADGRLLVLQAVHGGIDGFH